MRHMAGNMRSRWTDLRTTEGEKPARRQDAEFEDAALTREERLAEWNEGWQRAHCAGHTCQIVPMARHLKGPAWQTLAIPRGGSEELAWQTRGRHRTDT